jgi:iron complex outermembrane receptor protein
VTAGTEERLVAAVRHGRAIGANGAWRAYAKVSLFDENRFADGSGSDDEQRRLLVGGRADWKSGANAFVLQSDAYTARMGLFDRTDTPIHGAYVRGAWTRTISPRADLQVQATFDYASRHVPQQFEELRLSGAIDVQHRFVLGRHDLMTGGNIEVTSDDTTPSAVLFFVPEDRTLSLYSAFVQDEIAIAPGRFWVTPGVRLLKNSFTGVEAHPALRARWKPAAGHTVWAAASRTVRLPSRFDRDIRLSVVPGQVLIAGSDAFEAETVIALEAGVRTSLTPRLSLDVAAFTNRYDDLRSVRPGRPGENALAIVSNDLDGRGKGVEVALQAQVAPGLRLYAGYTRLATSATVDAGAIDLGEGVLEFNDPDHQFDARMYTDLPGGFELDGFLRYVSALPHPEVPAYAELDARVGWVSKAGHEFAVIGRNLLQARHPEFGQAGPRRYEFERAVLLRSTWRF